jgi:3',5'-cyclic AMP phosphodiesterase CpdA
MSQKLGWKKKYPFKATIKSDSVEASAWLRSQFGHDYLTLSSGRRLVLNRKDRVWAFEKWEYTGSTYGFGNEEHKTWFLLRWS